MANSNITRKLDLDRDRLLGFQEALYEAGLRPEEIIPDGKIHRCGTSDKPESKNGWYVFFANSQVGACGDWASGLSERWSSNGRSLTRDESDCLSAEIEFLKKEREREENLQHKEAAKTAEDTLNNLPNATVENPYLVRKGVKPCPKLKSDADTLVVPVLDEIGKPMSFQRISPNGEKRFLYGGQAKGGYFPIPGDSAKSLYICEGIATGLSINEGTGANVICAFGSGNLPPVAKLIRESHPNQQIIIASDNDQTTEARKGVNPGLKGAIEAAEIINGDIVLPEIDGDFNDLHQIKGLEAVKQQCSATKTPLQVEIDRIAILNLDPIKLSDTLASITEKLSRINPAKREGYIDYIKNKLNLKSDFMKAVRQEAKYISKEDDDEGVTMETVTSALSPNLIDLVTVDGDVAYLMVDDDRSFSICHSFTDDRGRECFPPEHEAIPFDILAGGKVLNYVNDNDAALYSEIVSRLQGVSTLPSVEHYHLCTVFIFFTYLSESSPYYPYLWFFGLPERGKSRIVKAICTLCYRGLYTETLNEAYLFRFADLFRGTLALDLYEISERAQKKGCHDLLLGRYEQGMKVARVTAPDKGPFRDTQYFSVSGPTILATNVDIPVKDPLRGRCIKITMPEARGIYPNNNSFNDLVDLKNRLLAFRGRHLGEKLPEVEKPIAGRLGDIIHPLLCIAGLLPTEAGQAIIKLIKGFEEERRETEAESLAGRITQALFDLRDDVINGRLPVDKLREQVNKDIDERYHVSAQTIGRELSALGLERKKSDGKMQIIFNSDVMEKIYARFGLPQGNLPNLPDLPEPGPLRDDGREINNGNLPLFSENLPVVYNNASRRGESRENREISIVNLPAEKPHEQGHREIREKREISSIEDEDPVFSDKQWGVI